MESAAMAFVTVALVGVVLNVRTKRAPVIAQAMVVAFVTEPVAAILVGHVMTAELKCVPWELDKMDLHFAQPMDFVMKNRIVFVTAHGLVMTVLKLCARRTAPAVECASAELVIAHPVSLVRIAPCIHVLTGAQGTEFARIVSVSARRVGEASIVQPKCVQTTATSVEDVFLVKVASAILDSAVLIA
jgi:hypothetical protein